MSGEDVPFVVDEIFIALFIEFFTSLIALFTNGVGFLIVRRVKRLRNSFGALCTFLVVGNVFVILIKLLWVCLPQSRIPNNDSTAAKAFGEITVFLWYLSIKIHVAISLDRFFNIAYPSKEENSIRTKIVGGILLAAAIVQQSCLHLYPGAYFAYNIADHSWQFRGSEWALTYGIIFDFYISNIEMSFVFFLDCVTLSKLRKFLSQNSDLGEKRKRTEGRLLIQSIFQSVPYMLMLVVYFEVTSRMESTFGIFLATTLSWQTCTALDGLFIIVFHGKKMLKKRSHT